MSSGGFQPLDDINGFSAQYARARDFGIDALVDKALEIADTPRVGQKRKETLVGYEAFCPKCDGKAEVIVEWVCTACGRKCRWLSIAWQHLEDGSPICEGVAKPECTEAKWLHAEDQIALCVESPGRRPVYEVEITHGDMVERARLMVESRKWLASKLAPKRYGTERIDIRNLHDVDWDNAPAELLDRLADHFLAKAFPDPAGAAATDEKKHKPAK